MNETFIIEIVKVSGYAGIFLFIFWRMLQDHSRAIKELLDQHNQLIKELFISMKTTQEAINNNTYHLGQIITAIDGCKRGDHRRD